MRRGTNPREPSLAALDLLAQHFQLQPFGLGGFQVGLRLDQRGRELGEGGLIAGVKLRIAELVLQLADRGFQLGDAAGKRLQRMLLVEAQPLALRPGG